MGSLHQGLDSRSPFDAIFGREDILYYLGQVSFLWEF